MFTMEFQAKAPYKTWGLWISGLYDEDAITDSERECVEAVCAAFEKAGWEVGRYDLDSGYPWWEIGKDGTGLFGGWTDDESRKFMAEARKILRKFGITRVPKKKLTLADML